MVVLNAKTEEDIELYNLSDDLGETNNLVDKEPDKTKEMYNKLKSARTESEIFPFYNSI